jgi:hypothetical protein
MEPQTTLLDHMRHVMRLKPLSLGTEEAYVSWARRFILLHEKRHPIDRRADEIRAFLTHLAVHGRVAASTQNGALNALVFLYRHVLRQPFQNSKASSVPNVHGVSRRSLVLKRRRPSWHNSVAHRISWQACSIGPACV